MNISERFELDNLFSCNDLGELCLENPCIAGIWKTDKKDYMAIRVPCSMRNRFEVFWKKAESALGENLEVLHIQEGTPLSEGYFIRETWYFITRETAIHILNRFGTILSVKPPAIR